MLNKVDDGVLLCTSSNRCDADDALWTVRNIINYKLRQAS